MRLFSQRSHPMAPSIFCHLERSVTESKDLPAVGRHRRWPTGGRKVLRLWSFLPPLQMTEKIRRIAAAAAWASVLCSAGQIRGAEQSHEIPPEALTKMTDTFKKAGVQKRKQFDALMHDEIALAARDTGLNADGIKSLEDAAAKAEDAAVDDFMAGCLQAVRAVYAKGGTVTLNWANAKTVATVLGPGGPTGDGVSFTGPLDQPAWKDGVAPGFHARTIRHLGKSEDRTEKNHRQGPSPIFLTSRSPDFARKSRGRCSRRAARSAPP